MWSRSLHRESSHSPLGCTERYPTQRADLISKCGTRFIFRSSKVTCDNLIQTSCNLTLQVIQYSTLHPKWKSKWNKETARSWFSQLQKFPVYIYLPAVHKSGPLGGTCQPKCIPLITQSAFSAVAKCHRAYSPNPEKTKSVTSLRNEILLCPANPLFNSFCSVCFTTFLYLVFTMWYFYTCIHPIVFKSG